MTDYVFCSICKKQEDAKVIEYDENCEWEECEGCDFIACDECCKKDFDKIFAKETYFLHCIPCDIKFSIPSKPPVVLSKQQRKKLRQKEKRRKEREIREKKIADEILARAKRYYMVVKGVIV